MSAAPSAAPLCASSWKCKRRVFFADVVSASTLLMLLKGTAWLSCRAHTAQLRHHFSSYWTRVQLNGACETAAASQEPQQTFQQSQDFLGSEVDVGIVSRAGLPG